MIKKIITYTDYNGSERTEEFYFHFSRAEAFELELSRDGGLSEEIKRIISAQSTPELISTFKRIILAAYGEKTPDGKHFMKIAADGHRLSDDFAQTEAYSKLFMELVTDEKAGIDFVNGALPKSDEVAHATATPVLADPV